MKTDRPKRLFTDSAIIIAVGTLVLTYGTAPKLTKSSTKEELLAAKSLAHPTNPTELAFPAILKLSLSEIGTPCKGPTSLPVSWRCRSSALARARASGNRVSVRQFVWLIVSESSLGQSGGPRVLAYQLMCNCCSLAESECDFFGTPYVMRDVA